ncbi:MAG: GDP-mannose 4,6-dehydratase [Polyangiaceae bacterium]
MRQVQPDEIYNLGAQSHAVRVSFDVPEYTGDVTGMGTTPACSRLRCATRGLTKRASTKPRAPSSTDRRLRCNRRRRCPIRARCTPSPSSPVLITVNYREAYNMYACNGILFNHESRAAARPSSRARSARRRAHQAGPARQALLGQPRRAPRLGFAGDYVEAMRLMLQQNEADDYVIATGESHTVREFLATPSTSLDMDYKKYVEIDPRYFRFAEVDDLRGDMTKAKHQARLGAQGEVPGAREDDGRRRLADLRGEKSDASRRR